MRAGQHHLADGGRREAGDGVAGACGCFGWSLRRRRAKRYKPGDGGRIAVMDGDGEAVAQEACSKVAAKMAEADEGVGLTVAHGNSGSCAISRCSALPV